MTTLAAVLAAAAVAAAPAAPSGWPSTGETIRVMKHREQRLRKGVVVETDAESLTVSFGSKRAPVRIPLASIDKLEVARGQRRAVKEGAFLGGITGAVLGGAAVSFFSYALCDNAASCGPSAEVLLAGVGIVGAAGAGVGALSGLAVKTDRWERVKVDRVRVAIRPVPAGAGVQVSLAWGGR